MHKSEGFLPPWELAEWQSEVRAWMEQCLAGHALSIVGPIEQPHIRPWSTVMHVPTEQGFVYFKAGSPNQNFEPSLMQILYKCQPEVSLPVLGADEARGWMLLPEGGQTLRQASDGEVIQANWEIMLRRFAELQIAMIPHTEEILAAGTPDHRPANLSQFLDKILSRKDLLLIGEEDGLTEKEYALLLNKHEELGELCRQLVNTSLPISLDHGDLHDANVFSNDRSYVFFDWGDASITHPFISLMIPLRVLGHKLGIEDDLHPELEWARQAYLQSWTNYAPMKELQETWELALQAGKFQRSITYYTIMELLSRDAVVDYQDYLPGWLQEFLGSG